MIQLVETERGRNSLDAVAKRRGFEVLRADQLPPREGMLPTWIVLVWMAEQQQFVVWYFEPVKGDLLNGDYVSPRDYNTPNPLWSAEKFAYEKYFKRRNTW